ncbi:MAG: serine/threonine protein kinase, partial [Deltaproteobacteria bacterium]|nr:serine/threonine protein kinase [Deltaproteobacteria bacterium]
MIGSTIDGKYEIQSLLGEGGMGSVYIAEHATTGRRCAVKVISSPDLIKDKQVLGRFEREARAAGKIDTQYITQVLDAGVDRETGLPFLAMEYLDGEDLQHLLKRVGPISPDLALRVVAQSCLGLQKAHAAKVVHRDIKPHNLFLAKRDAGEVVLKLLDFGIAKVKMDAAQSREGADLTKTGNLLGSPLYVSPEQARGKRAIDHRTDIYSLGAVAYQMLAGRTPYEHATALGELILMICTEEPPPVQEHAPWCPPEIAQIVHKCLAKSADARFQTAQELFDAVRGLLAHGWGIHEDMLVSLEDSQRLEQAPRAPMSVPPPAMASGAQPAITAATGTAMAGEGASTTGPLTQTGSPQTADQVAPSSKLPLVLGAAAAVALVGGGIFAMTGGGETQAAPTPTETAATTSAPTAEPSETAPATSAPEPVKAKRVHVVIIPSEAKVEIEGKPVTIKNGVLEIEDVPGSVHRVKAYKGKGSTTVDVVVTEAGALPPKIEVKAGKV